MQLFGGTHAAAAAGESVDERRVGRGVKATAHTSKLSPQPTHTYHTQTHTFRDRGGEERRRGIQNKG